MVYLPKFLSNRALILEQDKAKKAPSPGYCDATSQRKVIVFQWYVSSMVLAASDKEVWSAAPVPAMTVGKRCLLLSRVSPEVLENNGTSHSRAKSPSTIISRLQPVDKSMVKPGMFL